MNSQWVDVSEGPGSGGLGWFTPLRIMIIALGLFIIVVIIGIIVNSSVGDAGAAEVTIADLRADPDEYDNREVALTGIVEDVYSIPVLDQYGIYDFRDETGSMLVLTDQGIPPDDGEQVRLTATYNGSITLDEQLRRIASSQFGSVVGSILNRILPGIPLNVTYLAHDHYELLE